MARLSHRIHYGLHVTEPWFSLLLEPHSTLGPLGLKWPSRISDKTIHFLYDTISRRFVQVAWRENFGRRKSGLATRIHGSFSKFRTLRARPDTREVAGSRRNLMRKSLVINEGKRHTFKKSAFKAGF